MQKINSLTLFQAVTLLFCSPGVMAAELKMGKGSLSFAKDGSVEKLEFGNDQSLKLEKPLGFSRILTTDKEIVTKTVELDGNSLVLNYEDGSRIRYELSFSPYVTYFDLKELDLKTSATKIILAQLPYPTSGRFRHTLNTGDFNGHSLGLMAGNPEVITGGGGSSSIAISRDGCNMWFTQTKEAKEGKGAAEFFTECNENPAGWSMVQVPFKKKLDLKNLTGLSAWVYGDGKGEQLKFQLVDRSGGARDYYVPIDFEGWKYVEFNKIAYDSLKEETVSKLNIYYNSISANGKVTCRIDDIQGHFQGEGGTSSSVSLENFEDSNSSFWLLNNKVISLLTAAELGFQPASFGIISVPTAKYFDGVKSFQQLAGISVPHPHGQWNKESDAARESYLFLTQFNHKQYKDGLEIAKRGGFKRILFGQESWCESTGHFNIHPTNFPGGVPMLKEMFDQFRAEGIECGLHFLAASIYPPDKYLTPVPDNRLITRGTVDLAEDIDASTTTLVVKNLPEDFPENDGGYNGNGTVLRIGDELISYGGYTRETPYKFFDCVRGHLGTRAASHRKGDTVAHLWREYGYHMFDMDSSLFDEVTTNFAKVVNGVGADMVYFDGAERLQGNHSFYNGKLIKGYHDKFDNKDILLQASSFSHYSWHLLARSASADGHGDLKGYLEERAPAFEGFGEIGMPLDIGWYYGYDTSATPDMYEYILGMSLGYNTSVSYQVSVAAAAKHPFTGQILDLIKRYETLRLNGGLPEELRPLFQVPKELRGRAPEDKNRPTHLRKDYRLAKHKGKDVFKRMKYGNWKTVDAGTTETVYDVSVTTESAKAGFQLQMLEGKADDKINKIIVEVNGQKMTWQGELVNEQYLFCLPGEKVTVYGLPLTEPQEEQMRAGWIPLKEGEHNVTVRVEGSGNPKFRFRPVLELPEFFPVPENR